MVQQQRYAMKAAMPVMPQAFPLAPTRLRLATQRDADATSRSPSRPNSCYIRVLRWAFAFFSSVRVFSYLPTMWAIWQSGDSSQHSLLTWCTWFGANLTMSLWLMERNDARIDGAAAVNLGNAAMCLAVIVLIAVRRL
jgi:hypothetical protein